MDIGVNFSYKAARLEPRPPLFKVQGSHLLSQPLFVRCKFCNAHYKAVLYIVTNNKMTLNDILGNQAVSFI